MAVHDSAPTDAIAEDAALHSEGRPNDNLGLVVGQNIKRLRSRRNLSLEALAKISGVSRAMLGQIETGRSVPTINVVWKIACAFDVPFSTLIAMPNAEAIRMLPASEANCSGAGDCLVAGCLFALAAGEPPLRSLAHGVAAATAAVQCTANVPPTLSAAAMHAGAAAVLEGRSSACFCCCPGCCGLLR